MGADKQAPRHQSTQHLLDLLYVGKDPEHLAPILKPIVRSVAYTAAEMADLLEDGPELTVGLRHLLDAKDALVRQRVIDLKAAGTPAPPNTPEPELRQDG